MMFPRDYWIFAIFYLPCLIFAIQHPRLEYEGQNVTIEARSLDEIYVAAQKETGDLVVLWGGDELDQGDGVSKAWETRFPNVKLNLTVDLSKYIDSRVDRHYHVFEQEGADVVVLQTVHDFDRWKKTGRLLPYKPSTWEYLYTAFRDPGGYFFGAFISQFGDIIYNPDSIKDEDVPDSFADFLQPHWKGKLTLTFPNDDDAVLYLFSLIIGKYGWSWLDALAQQDVRWVRGTGTTATLLADPDTPYIASFTGNLDGPGTSIKTPKDHHMLWPQTCAAFGSTSRPESAKLFLSWLVSDEFQKVNAANGDYLVRSDLNSSGGVVWDDKTADVTQFWKFMGDRETVEWWRLQIESTLGTPQGVSPLHDGV